MAITRTKALPTLDPGMKSLFHYTSDGEVIVERQNDVTGILKANQFQRSEQSMRYGNEAFHHVARIDEIAIKEWMAQRGVTKNWWYEFCQDPKLLNEFLNDPDNEVWRTRKGKI